MSTAQTHAFLVAVSDELAEIRIRLEELADLTTELVVDCPSERYADVVSGIQSFDLLIQRLDGLSGATLAVGSGNSVEDAALALTLSDLAQRLSPMSRPQSAAGAGDLLLFE